MYRRMFSLDSNDNTKTIQELQILTVGTNTFVADERYSVNVQYPNNFRLQIRNVTKKGWKQTFYQHFVIEIFLNYR